MSWVTWVLLIVKHSLDFSVVGVLHLSENLNDVLFVVAVWLEVNDCQFFSVLQHFIFVLVHEL